MNMAANITEEQLALRAGQRAMIAAKLANVPRGQKPDRSNGGVSNGDAAKMLSVHPNSVVLAKQILAHASPEVIKAVEEGRVGLPIAVKTIARQMNPNDANAKHMGKNPARVERRKQIAVVWNQLRDAVTALATLPAAADVLSVAKKMDRHNIVLPKVPGALAWLKEFADVCNGEAAHKKSADAGEEAAPGRGEV